MRARAYFSGPIIDRFRKLNVMDAAREEGEKKGKREGSCPLWPRSCLSTSLLTSTTSARLLRTAAFFPTSDVYERAHFSIIFNLPLLPFVSPVFSHQGLCRSYPARCNHNATRRLTLLRDDWLYN